MITMSSDASKESLQSQEACAVDDKKKKKKKGKTWTFSLAWTLDIILNSAGRLMSPSLSEFFPYEQVTF